MEQFAYSFIITMLHSVWQMALLLLVYFTVTNIAGKWQPLAKRNLMLLLLAMQLLLSVSSFYFIYSTPFPDYRESIQQLLQGLGDSQTWLLQYSSWIFTAYSFALMYKITATVLSWLRFKNIYTSNLIKASAEIRNFTSQSAHQFGIKQKVQVWYSNHIQSPVVFGFLKPMILLPVAMINRLSVCQAEALIIHELTHIKYKDYLYNWILLVAEAVYFFNPFVKIAIRHIKIEREKNCDAQVLQFNYSPVGYAEALLLIAKQQLQPVQVPVAAVSKSNELLNRIRYFSSVNNSAQKNMTRSVPLVAIMLLGLFFANVFLAGLHLTSSSQKYTAIKLKGNFSAGAAVVKNEYGKTISTKAFTGEENIEEQNDAAAIEPATDVEDLHAAAEDISASQVDVHPDEEPSVESYNPSLDTNPIATSVSLSSDEPVIIKDMMINEESSNGTSTTRVFRITQSASGEWKIEPLMMVKEQVLNDSLKNVIRKDSTVIHIIPTVQ